MNDENLERQLRQLPLPELPAAWKNDILSAAHRSTRARLAPPHWPPLILQLRRLLARNPFTATALTTLWLLIFLLRATTPVDPAASQLIARSGPIPPPNFDLYRLQTELALLEQDQPSPPPQLQP